MESQHVSTHATNQQVPNRRAPNTQNNSNQCRFLSPNRFLGEKKHRKTLESQGSSLSFQDSLRFFPPVPKKPPPPSAPAVGAAWQKPSWADSPRGLSDSSGWDEWGRSSDPSAYGWKIGTEVGKLFPEKKEKGGFILYKRNLAFQG